MQDLKEMGEDLADAASQVKETVNLSQGESQNLSANFRQSNEFLNRLSGINSNSI